ncbi:MraY family glycosyltransferase [Paraburkholderia domus]|uniref:MraY family glycosyltransferase n=1 Tax=Paraburkholderia domus TaxID=2793075 RepID=UPI001913F624|nr:glycosyltransferase [Paraburkholderia domus]MBK5065924.1 glycosyltransferase family 4 protein [Burkholderia sp. R-70199]
MTTLFFILPISLALLFVYLILRFERWHARFTFDHDTTGVQKYHARAVPRVGGVAILLAIVASLPILARIEPSVAERLGIMLLCGSPAVLSGVIEDLTKRVSPRARLLCAIFSGLLASYFLRAVISSRGLPFLEFMWLIPAVAIVFSSVAIAGVANAMNIIDGFNGLSSGVGVLVLASQAWVAYMVGDQFVFVSATMFAAATLGFFVWNFPRGKIFLGDGGAYLIGFCVSVLAIVLISENTSVSPWYGAVVLIYPVFETLFSVFRRKVIQRRPAGQPDSLHLHTLVHRRVARFAMKQARSHAIFTSNSMTSPYLWAISALSIVPATLFWYSDICLIVTICVFALVYVYYYSALVNFRRPIFMRAWRQEKFE